MVELQARAAQIQAAGRIPVYSRGYAIVERPEDATGITIQLGPQPGGRILYMLDLDSHTEHQNADAARAALAAAAPDITRAMDWHRSQHGGWHGFFESYQTLPTGRLFLDGRHVGELLGRADQRTLDPGDMHPRCLTTSQSERLTSVWAVACADDGERWTARMREGLRYVAGYGRIVVSQAQLRAFLRALPGKAGPVGKHLDDLFDQRQAFDRSAAAGNLMQTLMLNAHRLPCGTGFAERCQMAMAYWMAADSYGKAADKDYRPEKDGPALIAKIIHEDPKPSGGKWTAPYWTKAHPTALAEPAEPEAIPRRPAHRPAGDQARMLRKLRRILEQRAFDSYGRISYLADDLADDLGVARRTLQNYLHILEHVDQVIVRGQDPGPGGAAWLALLPAFWGAKNSELSPESAAPTPAPAATQIWGAKILGANETATERSTTPQSAESTPQCKEDHQKACAPAPAEPGGASYHPDADVQAFLRAWVDPTVPRMRAEPRECAPPPRRRRQPRAKGQAAFTRMNGDLLKRYARRPAGQLPPPSPARAGLPLEALPDPPAAAAPLGAYGSGDPSGAPAGAPAVPSVPDLIARLQARLAGIKR